MKKNKKVILGCLIIIGLLFLMNSENVSAKNSSKGKSSCGSECKICANNICTSDFKISMDVSSYNRDSWKTGQVGEYHNVVSDRTVTVTVPQYALDKGAVYRIRVFYGAYGTIDSDFFNLDSDLDDLDNDDLDDGLKVFKTKIKKDNVAVEKENSKIKVSRGDKSNTVTVTIKSGAEAVVVAYLNADTKTGKKCKNSKNKEFEVKCINGKETEVNDGAISLSGVSASEYVQNPSSVIELKNLRGRNKEYGKACNNAYNGVYDSETATDEKNPDSDKKYSLSTFDGQNYTPIDSEALAYYRNKYYPQMIGTYYCDKDYVAFNLTEAQIAKLSNRALRLFYKSWKLANKSKSSSSYSDTYTEVLEHVKDIKNKKDDYGNPVVEVVSNTDVGLQCQKDVKEGITNKEYLYVEDKPIATVKPLSDGSSPIVCNTICYEHLTVSYDPPVASIAGLCFTYKVTVKSETECGVKYKKELLEGGGGNGGLVGKLQKEMCSPVPICAAKASHTQAGPSDEFDSCIKKCDDGKYSQKCINECYTKVYEKGNNSKQENNKNIVEKTNNNYTTQEILNLNSLTNKEKSNNGNILKIKTWSEQKLEGYSSQNTAINKCDTKREVLKNIGTCAEYFFEAKTLYPKGHYNASGTAWKSDVAYNSDKDNIWNAIGRASPFYVRDKQSTKELIYSILDKDIHNGRTYYIDSDGIKRQYRGNWVCSEECSYTGCSTSNALTPKAFINGLNVSENKDDEINEDDLEIIDQTLETCSVSAACDTEPTIANFDIKIINPRKGNAGNEVEKSGTTDLKNTSPMSENETCPDEGDNPEQPDPDDVFSMFVPADEDINSKYGILGLCYDNTTQKPQYKTTITFPGSWINYKTRKMEYDMKDCKSGWALKGGYFCSAYDSVNVNEKWWQWRTEAKDKDGNVIYPTFEEPTIKDNIQASAKNFGKYNWNINYSCFYGIYSGKTCPPDNPCCDGSTCLQNYKFQVIDAGKFFTDDTNQKQGYNWTSKATIKTGVNTSDSKAVTYTINPQKYLEYIHNNEKNETIYDTKTDDYYIYLSSDGIKYIKNTYKNRAYADYVEQDFKEDKNIIGLVRYTSSILRNLNGHGNRDIVFTVGSNVEGTNNNYNDLNSLLDTD